MMLTSELFLSMNIHSYLICFTLIEIYEKVWGEALTVNERGTVGYHVRNLRRKLYSADPHHPFIIESIREIGYRFQTTS